MKKYQEGGGLREGKARFGDDIRKRAMKEIEGRGLSDAEAAKMLDREPKKPSAEAKRVPTPRRIPAKPLESKEAPKVEETPKTEVKPKTEDTPKPKSRVAPPDPKAAAARQKMWEGNSPITDAFNLIRGKDAETGALRYKKKAGGSVKMAAGGSVSKRADGCAIRGKTRGKVM